MLSRRTIYTAAVIFLLLLFIYVAVKWNTLAGILYQTIGDEESAIAAFENSGDAYSLYHLGLILKDRGELERAKDAYIRLLKIQPDHPHANYDLGYIYREQRDFPNAIKHLRKALEINPDNVYAHYDMGFVYKETGQYDKALKEYGKVLELEPGHRYALWDIGEVYKKMGMQEKAKKQFEYYHEMTDCSFRRFWNCFD